MIKSFRHKGLKALYERSETKGVDPAQLKRVRALLARLDAAREPRDMGHPGLRLHPMKGDMKGF